MRRGFTLIELILVIALIALVGGLVVVNARAILGGLGDEPVEMILQDAVREARFQAASLKQPTYLAYNEEAGSLRVLSETGGELATFSTRESGGPPGIVFEQILPTEGIAAGSREELVTIKQVVFRPDRSSTPFQATIEEGVTAYTLRYDPFSAIVIKDSRND